MAVCQCHRPAFRNALALVQAALVLFSPLFKAVLLWARRTSHTVPQICAADHKEKKAETVSQSKDPYPSLNAGILGTSGAGKDILTRTVRCEGRSPCTKPSEASLPSLTG